MLAETILLMVIDRATDSPNPLLRDVVNPSLPVLERPNKSPILISGVDTGGFLAWLRSSRPYTMTTQFKAEKLIVMPSTANGFQGLCQRPKGRG
jgi:hypothetical protein